MHPDAIEPLPTADIHIGNCLDILRSMSDSSIDAVVTDPPYALDTRRPDLSAFARAGEPSRCAHCAHRFSTAGFCLCSQCLDTARGEALMLAPMLGMQAENWHGSGSHTRGHLDNDNALFQRWVTTWASELLRVLKPGGHVVAFGGTRSWHRLAAGIEDAGFEIRDSLAWLYGNGMPKSNLLGARIAKQLNVPIEMVESHLAGRSSVLKPGFEPIVLARRPLSRPTLADNVLTYETGALNIDACRTGTDGTRWPANVFVDQETADHNGQAIDDIVGRFFWVAKPGPSERPEVDGVKHPTVKPLGLMRELVRLATPPGGVVLEPFAGSGTTAEAALLEGHPVIAIERDANYLPLIQARVARARSTRRSLG